ncbi:fumarylacetoacetase [Phytohabitans sp. ZYX-F-186]|uniref:fumarylacetoacetase n=1 Tax=Phytohabitans maris TaxID=3071409 RepID=A0ABU0ZAS3_9ACTN|nr:fumarylacetoacetase [Phytohabitans sp. ZYX-F-186]MDQ7904139.1 fumarylacetoacetase [Phytohabitans sp. ZYX-F-186]
MSWVTGVDSGHPYGVHNLPYGAVSEGGGDPRLVVRVGDLGLDLAAACERLLPDLAPLVAGPVLNPLLAAPAPTWRRLRAALVEWLTDESVRPVVEPLLTPLAEARTHLPFAVGDYVDFYASEHHASAVGRIFRPDSPPLPENWKHLPIGYHGRSGTVVVSGTPVARPSGQRRLSGGAIEVGPSRRLDIEAEVGFVLGAGTRLGEPVALADAAEHVFGVCLVNDWSARDLQAWEYVPLGPFLGKSFATSVSPWVVPLDAFDGARTAPPPRDVALASYLDDAAQPPWGLDIALEVELNGTVVSRPPFPAMYWTAAQMLAHMTVNGASIRPGDLFASGTVSGPEPDQAGSLLELSRGGRSPIELAGGVTRSFLEDGDRVVIRGRVPAAPGRPELALGEVAGVVVAALQ